VLDHACLHCLEGAEALGRVGSASAAIAAAARARARPRLLQRSRSQEARKGGHKGRAAGPVAEVRDAGARQGLLDVSLDLLRGQRRAVFAGRRGGGRGLCFLFVCWSEVGAEFLKVI
jgi:hypothetical protein